jgi:DNA-binding NarL/FixJ family response regulator
MALKLDSNGARRAPKEMQVIDHRPTIVLADSSLKVLSAACALIEPSYSVLKMTTMAEEAVSWAMKLSPDLAVIEICMPKMSGIAAARMLNLAGIRTRIVLTADIPDDDYLREARAVALGYVLKRRLAIDLVPALEAAVQGLGFYMNQKSCNLIKVLT